ncbi:MobV family relaxase [Photobacterium indicum]|uniref:MobV family relaxase n=1 Tax=Photobacterium indicum TaxID=81447 RepID=UPI003D0AF462
MAYVILRTAKLKTNGSIASSLDHNYRERETHNADSQKAHLNSHDCPSKNEAYQAIQDRLPDKVRKDGVRCIEYMITASPEFFKSNTRLTQDKYFESAKEWLIKKHGEENVITTSIHQDETSPHLIAYVVPFAWSNNKQKETLNCKAFLGGRKLLSEMQTDFHKHVQHFGLQRGVERSTAKHQTVKEFYSKIKQPIPSLKEIAAKIDMPEPKVFESKQTYGINVAEHVWDAATAHLQVVALKTTYSNYKKLEKDNEKALYEIGTLMLDRDKYKKQIDEVYKNSPLIKKLNALPNNQKSDIHDEIKLKYKEHKYNIAINPIKVGRNEISLKWDVDSQTFSLAINNEKINDKVPTEFLEKVKAQRSFLSVCTIDDLRSNKLNVPKVNGIITYFDVNENGDKVDEIKKRRSMRL